MPSRIAAGDDVDEEAAVGDAVEGRRHAGGHRRRLQAGTDGDQESQSLGEGRQRRGHDPGVLAAAAGRQEHAEIAEAVGRLRHLLQIGEVDGPAADRRAEIAAVAVRRQEPENVHRVVGVCGHARVPRTGAGASAGGRCGVDPLRLGLHQVTGRSPVSEQPPCQAAGSRNSRAWHARRRRRGRRCSSRSTLLSGLHQGSDQSLFLNRRLATG